MGQMCSFIPNRLCRSSAYHNLATDDINLPPDKYRIDVDIQEDDILNDPVIQEALKTDLANNNNDDHFNEDEIAKMIQDLENEDN